MTSYPPAGDSPDRYVISVSYILIDYEGHWRFQIIIKVMIQILQ